MTRIARVPAPDIATALDSRPPAGGLWGLRQAPTT